MLLPLTDCFLSLLPLRRSGLMHVKVAKNVGLGMGFPQVLQFLTPLMNG